MSDKEQRPEETAEADRLVREALQKISEHTDTVMILVTKKLDNGEGETWRMILGTGNWYARYGLVREWLNQEEGIQHRRYEVDDTED